MDVDAPFDEELYCRAMFVYGRPATQRLAASSALLVGLRGVGAEVGAFHTTLEPCDHCAINCPPALSLLARSTIPPNPIARLTLAGSPAHAAKNLVLSGVRELILHDPECVTHEDLCAQVVFRSVHSPRLTHVA